MTEARKMERQPGVAATAKYKRILLKLSGEALMGDDSFGINRATIERPMIQSLSSSDRKSSCSVNWVTR